jgi:CO/xanthine dehydrogenase Mo-binding subunit
MNKPETLKKLRVVGTTPVRPDGQEKVMGRAIYGDDFRLPGMLHGRVLRSPHAHAVIKSIDTRRAEKLAGVRAIITGKDFPKASVALVPMGEGGYFDMNDFADNCIAKDKAYYHGHAVAAVAADSPHIAEEALALIDVKYEVLKPVMNVRQAMAKGAPVLHKEFNPGAFFMKTEKVLPNASRLELKNGDVAKGMKEADAVVGREYTTETVHQGYIESHICTAQWESNGLITIWCTTQGAFAIRDQVSIILAVPMSKVKVIPLEIGGGFGGKDTAYIEPLAAMLARKADKPVKIVMSRAECLLSTGPSSGTHMKVKVGAKKDGTITAADLSFAFEAGAFPGGPIAAACLTSITRYNMPNVRIEGFDVMVNKPKIKPYRAPGATQSHFAVETALDELAEKIGMDPVEFRLKNAMKQGDRLILGFPCPPIGTIELLNAVKDHPHYNAPLKGQNRGRGMAMGFWFGAGLTSSAELSVNGDGTVQLCTGSCDLSGTRLTLAMQAAEALGLDIEDVVPSIGDTHSVGYTFQSVGSRTTFATGIAVYETAQKILKQMAERAAAIWETEPENVVFGEGIFTHKQDAAKRFGFKELAAQLDHTGGPVSAQSTVTPHGVGFQIAAHLVDVEVDTETGKIEILRYTAFQDAGKAVHPDFVEGQMQGGAVQGIGWALNEEYWYDAEGRLCNTSLLDYRMPTALDMPMVEAVIIETGNPGHPYGVRGVGEVPIVPPPAAIANAVYRAIGVRPDALPMTPAKILKLLQQRKGAAAA